jgi:polypeptide N-acetylgalactosaminyltransferase
MIELNNRGLPLRRKKNCVKIVIFIAFWWWLVVFGFNQEESNSDFGEHLDRNRIEIFKTSQLKERSFQNSNEFGKTSRNWKDLKIPKVLLSRTSLIADSFPSPPPNIFGIENLGEMGKAVSMPVSLPAEIQKIFHEGWKKNSFNQYLSDQISVRRSLPDMRTEFCRAIESTYHKNLPATSVIIIFYNEAWSTLLRSVHSVLDCSPEHLISEVILVDDFSDMRKIFVIA